MKTRTVPALAHDALMLARYNVKVTPAGKLERRIVWNLLGHLRDAGFPVASVDDGDDDTAVTSDKAAMELVFNLDDCHVFFHDGAGGFHWVRLIGGNGIDMVGDWGCPADPADPWNAAMDAFDGENYA